MNERHETPCGHAVKKLCERAHGIFDESKYKNLSNISVSHLYNLRETQEKVTGYQLKSLQIKTKLKETILI